MEKELSEEYEEKSLAAIDDGNHAEAQVFASLAIAAALREAGDVVAEAFDVSIEGDEDGEGEVEGDEDGEESDDELDDDEDVAA